MILCTCSTVCWDQVETTKCKSSGKNMWKVCLFYSQNNILWWLNMANAFVWKIHEVRKDTMYAWAIFFFLLDCAFQVLIGWTSKLWSHGWNETCRGCALHDGLQRALGFRIHATMYEVYWPVMGYRCSMETTLGAALINLQQSTEKAEWA